MWEIALVKTNIKQDMGKYLLDIVVAELGSSKQAFQKPPKLHFNNDTQLPNNDIETRISALKSQLSMTCDVLSKFMVGPPTEELRSSQYPAFHADNGSRPQIKSRVIWKC